MGQRAFELISMQIMRGWQGSTRHILRKKSLPAPKGTLLSNYTVELLAMP